MEAVYSIGLLLFILATILMFPIYVLTRLAQLRQEVEALKWRVAESVEPVRATPPGTPLEQPLPVLPAAVAPSSVYVPSVPVMPRPAAPTPVVSPPPPVPVPEPQAIPTVPAVASAGKRDLESLLGANWLAKMGVAAIVVAAAFFLQYAFRSGWIGPTGQVAIGLIAAASMLAAGQYLLTKERYRNYAQVLASGGIVVFFLAIYAAYSFYHPRLMGFGPAFGALALGALAASVLALANDTEIVALLCILGAFATPVLIREGGASTTDSLVRLYAYLGALNLWVAGLTRLRPWHSLSVVSFAGTWLLFFGAGPLHGSGWQAEGFASLFLLSSCYFGARALYASKTAREGDQEVGLRDTMKAGLGLIVGGCIAFAITSALILTGLGLLGLPDVALAGLLLALLLAGLAVALPALGRYDRPIRLLFGYLAAVALAVMMVMTLETSKVTPREQVPIAFGFALFNYLLFLVTALVLHRHAEEEGPAAALVGANAFIHILMALHILEATRLWNIPAATLWLPLAGWLTLGGLWIATRQRAEARLLHGTLMAAAQILPLCGLFAALSQAGSSLARWPLWSATLVGAEFVLLSATWLALRRRIAWPSERPDIAAAFGNAAIFFGLMACAIGTERYQGLSLLAGCALAMAAYHAFVGAITLRRDDLLHRLIYLGMALTFVTIAIPLQLKASYITLAWAVEAAALVWTGVTVREGHVRGAGLILLLLAAGKALLFDLTVRPEPFHPFFNPRMLAGASVIAAAFLSAWWLWREGKTLSVEERYLPAGLGVLANAFTLLFVSVDLWDYAGMRWPAGGTASAQQLALSLFWTGYALAGVSAGIWKRIRPVRLFAMGLLYLSIGKVFLFDLRHLETPYRIVSFFTLGVILLLVSLLYTRFEERLHGEEQPSHSVSPRRDDRAA